MKWVAITKLMNKKTKQLETIRKFLNFLYGEMNADGGDKKLETRFIISYIEMQFSLFEQNNVL